MANFSVEGNYTNKSSPAPFALPVGTVEFFLALNIFLSITASLGNSIILFAVRNAPSINPATKLMFRCLAVTDLFVGLILQPVFVTRIILRMENMSVNVLHYVYQVWGALGMVLCGVSVMTSTAISVDRLLALLLGLRYRHVVTLRRVRVVVTCVWLIAASLGFLWVWKRDVTRAEASVLLILCLAISIFSYTRIHFKLRHQQALVGNNQLHGQQNGEGIPRNIAKYKRTVSSIMWVQLALVACYVPWGVVAVLDANGLRHEVAWLSTQTLVYLNSSLNPILYCWKIREVKQSVKDLVRQFYCC